MQGRFLLKKLFGSLVWDIPARDPFLFLTFDDGPVAEITPWVLQQLEQYQAKATFFCVGENVNRNPGIYQSILDAGHSTGNHTARHLNGWKTKNSDYLADINQCRLIVHSDLFRPPYGKIKPSQIRALKSSFHIIMWDVLSRDYDLSESGESCVFNVTAKAKPGSIVVFHDSIKAKDRLVYALPRILEHFHSRGFRFCALTDEFLK